MARFARTVFGKGYFAPIFLQSKDLQKNLRVTPCFFASDKNTFHYHFLSVGSLRSLYFGKGNFASLFYSKSFAVSLAPSLFREKSRSIRLLACKRARAFGKLQIPQFYLVFCLTNFFGSVLLLRNNKQANQLRGFMNAFHHLLMKSYVKMHKTVIMKAAEDVQ